MTNEEAVKMLKAKRYCMELETSGTDEDCISRQAVSEYITTNYGFCHNLIEEIKDMPPVTPQQTRWIPVSERLPEPKVAVLTYINTGATETYCLAYWNDMLEAWEDWISTDLIEEDKGYKVIAWRELPEPY